MSALHIVPLPGIDPSVWRGFAMILELEDSEPAPTEEETKGWEAFAALAGARAIVITERDIVVLGTPGIATADPGPCPFYMPQPTGGYFTCDLRAGHDGLCEHAQGEGPDAMRATWGQRLPWLEGKDLATGVTLADTGERGKFGQCMAVADCPEQAVDEPGGSCGVHRAMHLGVCTRKGCDRPTLHRGPDCEVHREPSL